MFRSFNLSLHIGNRIRSVNVETPEILAIHIKVWCKLGVNQTKICNANGQAMSYVTISKEKR